MEEAVGEGTLNEFLDDMSNEGLVAELEKRNLSTEGTRFEIIQRLAKARYAELGFNWPDPQASDLAAGGVNPDGKQPDPFQPISSQVKRTPPKQRRIIPQVDETMPWPDTPAPEGKNIFRTPPGFPTLPPSNEGNNPIGPPLPQAFGGARQKDPNYRLESRKVEQPSQQVERPGRASSRLPDSCGDWGLLDLGRQNPNPGGYARFRENISAPTRGSWQPRDVDPSTEEDDLRYDRDRPRRRDTRRADNNAQQRNLQNARIIESIKKWNIKFSGKASEDPENFLVRMRESMQVTNLSPEDFFVCLPFFFEGVALEWHRNSKHRWQNYDEFCRHFRKRFGPPDFQHALQDEVRRRTQGSTEPVLDYLTCMQALLNRLVPRWPEVQQVDLALRNMVPRMQLGLERGEYETMEELEVAAQRRERYLKISKDYKAPPAPEVSILPDLEYRETPRKGPTHRLANLTLEETEAELTPNDEELEEQDFAEDPEYLALLQARRPFNRKTATRTPQKPQISEEMSDRCFRCGQSGHISRNCQDEGRVFCRSCGKVGCTRSTCPSCPAMERSYCTRCGRKGVTVSSCKECAGNA